MPEQGEKHLALEAPKAGDVMSAVNSTFQIADVTRPLMSVGHICDQGLSVGFDKVCAIVSDPEGNEVCRFTRADNGLYICKIKLKAPFGRQGK